LVAPQTDSIRAPQHSPTEEVCQYTPHGLLRTNGPAPLHSMSAVPNY
jgi:hypothetical protein